MRTKLVAGLAALLAALAAPALVVLAYAIDFDTWPPTYLNVAFWIDPSSAECEERYVTADGTPFLDAPALDRVCLPCLTVG